MNSLKKVQPLVLIHIKFKSFPNNLFNFDYRYLLIQNCTTRYGTVSDMLYHQTVPVFLGVVNTYTFITFRYNQFIWYIKFVNFKTSYQKKPVRAYTVNTVIQLID